MVRGELAVRSCATQILTAKFHYSGIGVVERSSGTWPGLRYYWRSFVGPRAKTEEKLGEREDRQADRDMPTANIAL